MEQAKLNEILKDDHQGILNCEGVIYGVYHKCSYWTGGSPAQAVVKLFEAFPHYRITKEICVYKVHRNANTNTVSACYESGSFKYTVEELREFRKQIRKAK